ncbi:flagellar export chaperone FliS [Pelotomaculum terephthalicicum JT]|uniref:flagellar export chaperone FliS n=1 Tax=Pelotomaculum TaxID=191373 RepID=UPI0009D4E6DB|nr:MULTISPECIES: flagellar export chaperone FliS [Pelotomaculum]MCG9968000.1 flagellar export chaperone FliS [Pelotomaculum terephthalicicum JT]OPX88601.1 MAG: Flagellar protein FliS [Pelotomaculum sp. PtaB.Bin117]
MNSDNPYNKYRKNAVITANQPQLAEMLYNGVVKFIRQAISHVEDDNKQEAHNAIIRAQEIFEYLAETLNEKADVAFNLAHLYDYSYRRLVDANVAKDTEILKEVLGLAENLRDTWHEARQIVAGEAEHADNADKLV